MSYDDYIKVRMTTGQKRQVEADAQAAGYDNVADYVRALLVPVDIVISMDSTVMKGQDLHFARSASPQRRLAAIEVALSSTPEGSQALDAAHEAISLINRKDQNDNPK